MTCHAQKEKKMAKNRRKYKRKTSIFTFEAIFTLYTVRYFPVRMMLCTECLYVIFPFYLLFSCSTHLRHMCCVREGETRETFHDISICCATLLEYVSSEMLSGNKQADNKRKCLECTDNMPDGCLIPVTECSCISFVLL